MTPYHIQVHTRGKRKELRPLGSIHDGIDLLDFIEKFLSEKAVSQQHETKVYRVDNVHRSYRDVFGIVKGGEHGITSTVEHLDDPNDIFYRTPDHGEYMDFYYQFHIPVHGQRGILVSQSLGIHSVYTSIRQDLMAAFREEFHGLTLTIDPVFSGEELNDLLQHGELAQLTFTQLTASDDIADAIDIDFADRRHFSTHMIVHPHREHHFARSIQARASAVFRKELRPDELYYTDKFIPSDVEAVYKYNGMRKTVRYSEEDHIKVKVDVTRDIQGETGKPDLARSKNMADTLVKHYLSIVKPTEE